MNRSFRIIVAFASLAALAGACTSLLGDFTVSTSGTADEGGLEGGGEAGPDAGDGGSGVTAVAADFAVYVAQTAVADASKSTGPKGSTLSYAWTLTPPAGSTATLAGASSATPSFVADVAGTYTLKVVVTAGKASDTKTVKVAAYAAPVFYAQGDGDGGGGGSLAWWVAGNDGKGAQQITCEVDSPKSDFPLRALFQGAGLDFWESPDPVKPSLFAAFQFSEPNGVDGGEFDQLWVGSWSAATPSSSSNCSGGSPANVTQVGADFGPDPLYAQQPRFSPDGKRIVFLDDKRNWNTVAANGTDQRVVVSFYDGEADGAPNTFDPQGFGGQGSLPPVVPRPQWKGTQIAWARPTAPSGWAIMVADDTATSTSAVYMTCDGVAPRQFAILADGSVVASYRDHPKSGEDLYLLQLNGNNQCVQKTRYTNLADTSHSIATDFEVSPDGKLIAFLQLDENADNTGSWALGNGLLPGGYVYVGPVDGTSAPTRVSNDPMLYGPRWIAHGSMLMLTRIDAPADAGGPPTSVVVMPSDAGGSTTTVVTGDSVTQWVAGGGSGGCSVARGAAPGGLVGLGVAAAAVARIVRRRRDRQRSRV